LTKRSSNKGPPRKGRLRTKRVSVKDVGIGTRVVFLKGKTPIFKTLKGGRSVTNYQGLCEKRNLLGKELGHKGIKGFLNPNRG